MGSPAERAPHTPTSSATQGTHATELDTGFEYGGNVSGEASPYETGDYPAHRATPAKDGVSAQVHAFMALKVDRPRKLLAQTRSTLDTLQARMQVLEQHQPQLEGQLDVLIQMSQPAAHPPSTAQGLSRPHGSDYNIT